MKKHDVQQFAFNLEDNLFRLHEALKTKTYQHDKYSAFSISDPKPRRIHKATVRDRVVHQAIFRVLYPVFDKSFIFDSYSCRFGKGTHQGVKRLESFCRKVSRNNRGIVYALKCDVRKYFDSVDQSILLELICSKIQDSDALWLVEQIVKSFEKIPGKGLPLGNVTSQLFANVYLNELDQFIKHRLQAVYYLRYCDDFVIVGESVETLNGFVPRISAFLAEKLRLQLHPDKITFHKWRQGIDFLGLVTLPDRRLLRTKTKRRMFQSVEQRTEQLKNGSIQPEAFKNSFNSYIGLLKHCSSYRLRRILAGIIGRFA